MHPDKIKEHLDDYAGLMSDINPTKFGCGLFFFSEEHSEDEDASAEVTAMALGPPKELAEQLSAALIGLSSKDPNFTPLLMAVALTLLHALVHSSEEAYPFIMRMMTEMKESLDSRTAAAESTVTEQLNKIIKSLH